MAYPSKTVQMSKQKPGMHILKHETTRHNLEGAVHLIGKPNTSTEPEQPFMFYRIRLDRSEYQTSHHRFSSYKTHLWEGFDKYTILVEKPPNKSTRQVKSTAGERIILWKLVCRGHKLKIKTQNQCQGIKQWSRLSRSLWMVSADAIRYRDTFFPKLTGVLLQYLHFPANRAYFDNDTGKYGSKQIWARFVEGTRAMMMVLWKNWLVTLSTKSDGIW